MVKKQFVTVKSVSTIARDTIEMVLENEYISNHALPGQFVHVLVPSHTLRRPISIANVDQKNNTITILFKVIGSGTEALATHQPGDTVDVLAPCGNGFNLQLNDMQTALLIGGGIGVPPLYYLGKALAEKEINVISILGFQSADHIFYEEEFLALGETYITTDDGSYGHRGFVTDVLHEVGPFDQFYSCGPTPMLQAVTNKLKDKRGYISLEERMGCGVGACFACVIPTNDDRGYQKICKDGPVFKAGEVVL
ncbi:MAG TPA: dihydroorotate dehydrogenase electron transfer subunit [Bacillota bacterium]